MEERMNRIARYFADETPKCLDFDQRDLDPSLPLQTSCSAISIPCQAFG
jgi:hypothetical protein